MVFETPAGKFVERIVTPYIFKTNMEPGFVNKGGAMHTPCKMKEAGVRFESFHVLQNPFSRYKR